MAFSGAFRAPFAKTFDAGLAAAAGNGLLNNLVAYWPLNEASGNALDAHTNALHLTDTNTVTNAAGKVYATARQYTAANSECHVRAGDDALLSTGDVDFTIAYWVLLNSLPAACYIAAKADATASKYEYGCLYIGGATNRFRFFIGNNAATLDNVYANSFGAISTGSWYFVLQSHDSVANTITISVNGISDTANTTIAPADGANRFALGAIHAGGSTFAAFFDGRIGPVAMWKSAAGGGGVLTAAQRTALWNGGAGLAYAAFTT